jgi:hypothetical protein
MPNHKKPSKEELIQQTEEAIEAAEALKDQPVEEEVEPVVELDEAVEPQEEIIEVAPEEPQEQAEPSKEEEQVLKEKLSASARENQKIYAKNRVINKALQEAEEIPEPTDEEMTAKFKDDWELMSEREREQAKEIEISKRWRAKIREASDQAQKIEKWNDSIDEFVEDPQTLMNNPELEGKTDSFREFASKEENNSVPFKILVAAFLHEQSTGKVQHTGKMFEHASGGPNSKPQPKSDKLSLDEARKLRVTNYPKYKEYLAAGKIEIDL